MAQFKKDKLGSSLLLPGNGHQGSSIQDILTSLGVPLRPTKARSVQFWSLSEYIRKLKGPNFCKCETKAPFVRGTFSSVINSETMSELVHPRMSTGLLTQSLTFNRFRWPGGGCIWVARPSWPRVESKNKRGALQTMLKRLAHLLWFYICFNDCFCIFRMLMKRTARRSSMIKL